MHKLSILIMVLILSACSDTLFDFSNSSFVYLSNNTAEPIALTFQSTLNSGDWKVIAEEVPPYQSVAILSIKRNASYASGAVNTVTTTATLNTGETVQLMQIIRAGLTSDSLEFSVRTLEFNSGSISDFDIHRFTLNATPPLKEIAFKSEHNAVFKNIHYAITESILPIIENTSADELEILSYNVWGLPLVSDDIATRFSLLPDYLANYDVILLQEAFDSSRGGLFLELEQEYPYRTAMLDGPEDRLYDGGVIIFSRYPIVQEGQFVFPDCSGADCFADKGVNYAEVVKAGVSYHVFATHTASFDTTAARNNRQIQFVQMKSFAESFDIPVSDTVIYAGDLNVNRLIHADDYAQMLSTLNASEPVFSGYRTATFDPDINRYASDPLSGEDHKQYLDYVLIDNAYAGYTENANSVFIPRSTHQDLWNYWDLSDHFPVHGSIK